MAVTPPPALSRAPLWMRLALALSLAVNLGVAGVLIGAALRPPPPERVAAMARSAGLGAWGPAFEREDRAALRRADQRARRTERPADRGADRAERARHAQDLAKALRADPFDPAAVRQINTRILAQGQARAAYGLDLVVDYVTTLDRPARLRMAERLEGSRRAAPAD